jgi:hypothetical protein
LKLADRLITFCLDNKISNEFLLKFLFVIYEALIRDSYVLEHKPANHHYIPRFLLRKFKVGNTDLIFQYTYSHPPKKVSIKKRAACILNLYSAKDKTTKGESDFIENQLFAFALEKYASRIIHQILRDEETRLTYLEKSIITSFVGFQYVRTPRFFHYVRLVMEYLHLKKGIPVDEMIKADFYMKTFFDNYYKITPQGLGHFARESDVELSGAHDLVLRLSLQIGNHLSSLIYKRNFYFLKARLPGFFYLSDSPAEIFNITQERSVGPFLWEMKENPLIFMPISPELCLYFLEEENTPPPGVIGTILEKAIPESIYQFAFANQENNKISSAFGMTGSATVYHEPRPY